MRSILMKFHINDVGNNAQYDIHVKRNTDGKWTIVMSDGSDPQYDYFVQIVGYSVPEVLHYLDNMEADAAAANATFNVAYITNLITPYLRNDPAPDNSSGYIVTLESVLL